MSFGIVTGMLETNLEMDEEGMTVPYAPLFDDVRKNHGFIDICGPPELDMFFLGTGGRMLAVFLLQITAKTASPCIAEGLPPCSVICK
jgi:hypothetical protein